MRKGALKALAGFALLFALYHAAEYMILFHNSPAGFLTFQLLFFVGAWGIAKGQGKPGLAAWGLDTKKRLLLHLLVGMMMGVVLYGSTFLLSLWLGSERLTAIPPFAAMATPLSLFAFGNFFSSFAEDVLTRGYVFHHLYDRVSRVALVLLSAVVYLLNHIYRLDDGIETYLYLFVLGVVFAIPLLLTKRLWFTGGMHWAGNITFYLTHELWNTEEATGVIAPNYILVVVALLLIPVNYFLLGVLGLKKDSQEPVGKSAIVTRRSRHQQTRIESL